MAAAGDVSDEKDRILTAVFMECEEGMGRPGLEPGTNALKGRCSTN
jgi:hypothetical protein